MVDRLFRFLCDPLEIQRIGKRWFIDRHEQLNLLPECQLKNAYVVRSTLKMSASFIASELLGVELQDAFPVWHGKRSSAAAQGTVHKHSADTAQTRSQRAFKLYKVQCKMRKVHLKVRHRNTFTSSEI